MQLELATTCMQLHHEACRRPFVLLALPDATIRSKHGLSCKQGSTSDFQVAVHTMMKVAWYIAQHGLAWHSIYVTLPTQYLALVPYIQLWHMYRKLQSSLSTSVCVVSKVLYQIAIFTLST